MTCGAAGRVSALDAGGASAAVSVAAWVRAGLRGQMAIVGRQLGQPDVFLLSLMWGRPKVRARYGGNGPPSPLLADPAGRWVALAFTHTAEGTTRLYQDGVGWVTVSPASPL